MLTEFQISEFSRHLYEAIERDGCPHDKRKPIARIVLEEMNLAEEEIREFITFCENNGGSCCDCEIGLNVLAEFPLEKYLVQYEQA